MKLNAKLIWMFGVVASVSLFCAGASTPSSAEEEYDEDTYGPKELIVWQLPVPRVTFSHKTHTKDAGLACDSCHDDLFQMEAGAAQNKGDFTMKGFADGKYCGACHDGSTAFKATADENCVTCHTPPKTITFTKPIKAIIFDHAQHVEMGNGCSSCHNGLFTMKVGAAEENEKEFTMEALYKGKFCGSCHDGNTAFASNTRCTACHIGVMGHSRLYGEPQKAGEHGGEHH